MKTITITAIKPIGSGKVADVKFTVPNSANEFSAKAWVSDGFVVGEVVEVETEKKENNYQGKTTEDNWIKKPKAKGGFKSKGGGGYSDPAKQALEEKKHADFLEKWGIDRDMEIRREAGIMSQVAFKGALEFHLAACLASSKAPEMLRVKELASDFGAALVAVRREIYKDIRNSE